MEKRRVLQLVLKRRERCLLESRDSRVDGDSETAGYRETPGPVVVIITLPSRLVAIDDTSRSPPASCPRVRGSDRSAVGGRVTHAPSASEAVIWKAHGGGGGGGPSRDEDEDGDEDVVVPETAIRDIATIIAYTQSWSC